MEKVTHLADSKSFAVVARFSMILLACIASYYAVLIRDLAADVRGLNLDVARIQQSRTDNQTEVTRRLQQLENNDKEAVSRAGTIMQEISSIKSTLIALGMQLDRIERQKRADIPLTMPPGMASFEVVKKDGEL